MPKLSSPPVDWDPNSVVGVRERIKLSGFGIKKPLNFEDQISQHKWKYAAGCTDNKTEKQAVRAHCDARYNAWIVVMADHARRIPNDDRTDEQTAAIHKVDHPRAYQKNRMGNPGGSPMIPPPAGWKPELVGEARAEKWKYAAGLDDNGNLKNAMAHAQARIVILRNARIEEVNGKALCDRTEEDHAVIKTEDVRKAKQIQMSKAYNMKQLQKRQDVCDAFLEKHPELLVVTDKPLTEQEAFDIALKLVDDKDSEYGKRLFEKLGSKTLRQALYEPESSTAVYVGAGRGFGKESYRFMVDQRTMTTLTREDGTNFKSKDLDYKNLDLVSVEIGHFTSWSDCTAIEAAMQLILDDLEVGSQRLWLQSGVGRDRRQLRGRDAKYIEKRQAAGEDGNLTFVCFITILKNVEVLSRCTDTVTGKDVVERIKAGSGTICRVHQPRSQPRCNPAQKAALDAARIKLGFNCIDINRKRKLDDLLSADSEDAMSEDERSENESDE
jgi:hypothetical protein